MQMNGHECGLFLYILQFGQCILKREIIHSSEVIQLLLDINRERTMLHFLLQVLEVITQDAANEHVLY